MKKTVLLLNIFVILVVYGNAQSTKYSASFMELGIGARALAMGSAHVGLSEDANGFYWNPSGIAFISGLQASSMYADLFGSLEKQHHFSFALPLFGGAALSVSWIRLSVDDIPRYAFDVDPASTAWRRINGLSFPLTQEAEGYFNSYDDAYVVTFAKYQRINWDLGWQYFELPLDFGYGVNFKMLRQSIDDKSGTGIGLDIGMILKVNLSDVFEDVYYGTLAIGLNVQDISETKISWDTDSKHKDRVERNFKFGFAYIQPLNFIKSQFTLAYDINSRYNATTHFGGEILYNSLFALRVGANEGSFTTGAGIYLWKFRIDYAYQGHDLGNSHRVSLLFGL
jgi:hypothetical protein